jgi:hypothetical protein
MKTFDELFSAYEWAPIRGCPGRFVLRGGPCLIAPRDLVGEGPVLGEHRVEAAPDPVVIARIEGGGLISFRKAEGRYIHTLNSVEGFERKLAKLGIAQTS